MKKERTKLFIKEMFMEILDQCELSKITVTDICKKCDISRWTFYSYYENVDALLAEIENEMIDQCAQKGSRFLNYSYIQEDVNQEDDINALIELLTFQKKNKKYLIPLLSGKGHYAFLENFNKMIYRGFANINIDNELTKKYIIEYMIAGMTNTRLLWIKNNDMSCEEYARHEMKMIWKILFANWSASDKL